MLLTYLARRLVLAVVALFGVVLVAFLVAHMVPADPLAVVLSDQATKDPSIRAAYVKRWGLDRSLPEQFLAYLANVFRGDLGESFTTRRPVLRDLVQFVPATVELSLGALLVSLVFGIPLGVWAAVRHNRAPDHATRVVALVGAASPIFWTGLIALYVFYYRLEWAPGPGRLDTHLTYPPTLTGFLLVDSLLAGKPDVFASALGHVALPALVLGWFIMGIVSRTTRAALLEVLSADYVRTARAKGLGEGVVVGLHALRNAMIPMVTVIGLNFASLLSGAVLTETVFAWPGIGRYAVTASTRLDYPAILGVTMLTAVIYITVNFVVDILYGVLDPRIRVQ
ncbi:MAG: ABC transporter permease [Candidatus Rokubacteria bacterium]|nr:ABC transporter permease [Candidatus Rokubacteria bacterium]